jgi:hypothetical protein
MLRIQSTFTRFLKQSVRLAVLLSFLSVTLLSLSACDSEPPALMKASKQFDSDEIRDKHVAHMRKNHMDELMHKRDETVYNGIRTQKYSLNACINCHVPEQHNGEVLRHTNPEHFCSTCHGYVAAKLDCFECHVDHPVKQQATAISNSIQNYHNSKAHTEINSYIQANVSDEIATLSLAKNVTVETHEISDVKTDQSNKASSKKGSDQ